MFVIYVNKVFIVWCVECKSVLDRDFNAAMNVAIRGRLKFKNFVVPSDTIGAGVSGASFSGRERGVFASPTDIFSGIT